MLPFLTRWGNNGVISINQKDLSINYDSQLLFKETIQTSPEYSYVQWIQHLNITYFITRSRHAYFKH